MFKPRVTVLIAHHNYQEYLPKAIKSVIEEKYNPLKICIVDSSDDKESVKDILRGLNLDFSITNVNGIEIWTSSCETIICAFLKEGLGPSYNRNVGIELTLKDTDIYFILDADDEFINGKISTCVNLMNKNREIGVIYADTIIENTVTGERTREYREPFDINRLYNECIVHSGAVISSQALFDCKDEFGYYDINMRTCEDYDLWTRICEKYMIVHIPQALTLVRVQPKNSTATVQKEIWEKNWKRVHQKRYDRIHKS